MKGTAGAVVALLMGATGVAADGLEGVRWDYRPLLIFTPSHDDRRLSQQTTMLAEERAGLVDRRLAIYVVERRRVFTTFGAPAAGVDAGRLRRRLRVPDAAFRVVLVGLDGGAKLTRDAPISTAELFATIDGMPMRRRELLEQLP